MARFSRASLPLNTLSSVPLVFFRAIIIGSAERGWGKHRRRNLLITLFAASEGVLVRGKMFLGLEMPWVICVRRPYLNKF